MILSIVSLPAQKEREHIDHHWMPGVGRLNWFVLFEALATLSHQPRLMLELRNKDKIGKAAQWLVAQGLAQ